MAKIVDMSLDERETHLNLTAQDRQDGKDWEVYTDDPVMMRKFESLGIEGKEGMRGGGKIYLVPQNQITFRRKRVMTDEQRAELSRRARENFGTASREEIFGEEEDID